MKFSTLIMATMTVAYGALASAQILPTEDKQSDAGLEDLYDKFENQEAQKADKKKVQEQAAEEKKQAEINKVSELGHLSPFEDIAVIEKKFLPKTNRLELSASGVVSTNNAFFNDIGANARAAFYFSEKYGIEGTYQYLSSSSRPITDGLKNNQHIQTTALVEPTGYYGASLKWTPIYGKMAWFQDTIVPFDIYFTPGVGVTTTSNGSATTFSIGAGQLFALSKSYGIRWDFNWNFYSANVVSTNGATSTTSSKAHNDLFLGIGFSFFIPEATYR
jgi:outer membrane beta-barrel protein